MRRLCIVFLLLFLLPTACTLNVTPSPTSTSTVSPTSEPTLVPDTPTPASTPRPSSELVLLGRMVGIRRSVACGILHTGGVAEYTDLTILSGVYYSDTIFAIHGCSELPRSEYSEDAGNLESFDVGDYHELRLTKQNVYDIGTWPAGTPEGSTYFCKVVNYYRDAAASPSGATASVDPAGQLWMTLADGKTRTRVTTTGRASAPAWSPDNRILGYIWEPAKSAPREAVLYNLSTQDSLTVTASITDVRFWETLSRLSWSPDSRYLILDSGTSIERDLAIVEVKTDRLVNRQIAAGYAWSPEGGRLVLGQVHPLPTPISLESGDSYDLAVLEIGQAESQVVLTGTALIRYHPSKWLPDGRILYDQLNWIEGKGSSWRSPWTITVDGEIGKPERPQDIP